MGALALAAVAPAATAAPSGPRLILLSKLRKTDRQWHALQKRVVGCPAAQTPFRQANVLHLRAIRRASRAGIKSLRARNALMSQAVVRLSRGAQACAIQARPSGPVVQPPRTVEPAPPPPKHLYSIPITVLNVVDGNTLDLSAVLGPLVLPDALPAHELSALDRAPCTSVAVVCLGLDRAALNEALRQVMSQNLLILLLRNLGKLDLAGITSSLGALLGAGDYAGLITVRRVTDSQLRLVPNGPVEQLAGLPQIPVTEIGRVQVIR
jgi:hypothetical protein